MVVQTPDKAPRSKRPRNRRYRRHPAEVTADRLGDHFEQWYDRADGRILDAIGEVRDWLDQIAQGER